MSSILNPTFRYVPAAATSVAETWRRFGWRPTTEGERRSRKNPGTALLVDQVAGVRAVASRARPDPIEALPETVAAGSLDALTGCPGLSDRR